MKNQNGFTLIELVVVIVLLGILAATAIPKYIDLKEEAAQSAVEGVAGSLGAAMALNYAQYTATNGSKGTAVVSCKDAEDLLASMPADYAVTSAALTSGTPADCTVTYTYDGTNTKTATFTGIAVP